MGKAPELLRLGEPAGRRLLAATVLGSGMGFLDGTIVNVALPRIGSELHADLAALQWVINGYTLALASLILVGGALGDRFGRKRMFAWGVAAFAVTSALCALAPTIETLIAARLLQGVAAALLTPGSLALVESSFVHHDRMRAIGAWTGMLGVATAGGPVLGGWLVGLSWRWAFAINLPLAVLTLLLLRGAPESRDERADGKHFDLPGIVLAPVALAAVTWALTEWPDTGATPATVGAAATGVVAAVAFVVVERRARYPMVPPEMFADRVFTLINVVTLLVYAALSGSMVFIALFLQIGAGWSPLAAGAASVPISVLMFLLAARFGAVATRFGPRRPMVIGALVLAGGLALLAGAPRDPGFVTDILPGMLAMGLGLSMLVAPLTGTVLAAAPAGRAGVASGINNAVSRTAGLLAVAALPLLVGLSGHAYADADAVTAAYRGALWWCVGLVLAGAVVTAVGLSGRRAAG
ncbi:MFS transporter [Nocardia coubleae]|uniref:MFS transporter n=1 Tax=Nocardia coubleae TaxID=356147 RepID=A0A846W7N3_9NOCA|nr:MFS transporter [Nocardia coubleae]NKX88597.1 MFS transporter [Nocardia coubleae]